MQMKIRTFMQSIKVNEMKEKIKMVKEKESKQKSTSERNNDNKTK